MKSGYFLTLFFAFGFFSCANKVMEDNSAPDGFTDIAAALSTRSDLSDFAAALNKMDLSDVKTGALSVFAVPNGAFANNSPSKSSGEASCGDMVMFRHIVEGKLAQAALKDSTPLTALDGAILIVTVFDGHIYINGVELTEVIPAGENVIFVVEGAIPCQTPEAPEKPFVPVAGITLNKTGLTLEAGKSETVKVFLEPADATCQPILWQCDKPDVASVAVTSDSTVFSITALTEGTANITFTVEGGYSSTCVVTVTGSEPQPSYPITVCGVNDPVNNLPWLAEIIEKAKTDKTGNYYGMIWLEKYNERDVFVTNMMLGSGGVVYHVFDCQGAHVKIEDPMSFFNHLKKDVIVYVSPYYHSNL